MNEVENALKSIPLEKKHIALNARMAPFGGWNMPIHYSHGIVNEHENTRKNVSIFDCSHMGQFRIVGDSAERDLDRLFPRLVSTQKINTCRYNFLISENGTVCDDLIVYRISETEFFIVVNSATIENDFKYIVKHLSPSTECVNKSRETVKLDLQGPKAFQVLKENNLFNDDLPRYFHFVQKDVNGVPCLVSRTGYTGELGFEIYFDIEYAEDLWDLFTNRLSINPAGLGARDTLRLEMGYPLYGHELSQEVTPIEAGFEKILNINHDFIGKKALLKEPKKKLIGIRFQGRRAVREGSLIYDSNRRLVGEVTSGSYSPSLKCAIAMAYINADASTQDDTVFGKVGGTWLQGTVESLPFYKNGSARL